jgi:STAM-binding protein
VYEAEGNDAQAYLLLYRHAKLILEYLAKHPERNLPENKRALSAANAAVRRDLAKLEVIRPRIAKRHDDYLARRRAQREALEALEGRGAFGNNLPQELDGLSLHQTPFGRVSFEKATLDAGQNRSLAAKLAQREVRRRDIARRSTRLSGVSDEEEQQRRSGGMWGDWDKKLSETTSEAEDDLSQQLQEVARIQNARKPPNFSVRTLVALCVDYSLTGQRPTSTLASHAYQYPSVPHKSGQERWSGADMGLQHQGTVPARPPKELIYRSSGSPAPPPPLPPKPPTETAPLFENPRPPPLPRKVAETAPPIPAKYLDSPSTTPRPSSPSTDSENLDEFNFKPSAYLENGTPLRTVFLPNQLREKFLYAASKNTRLNLETCGILCGILKSNALFITRLLIPEQTSTSDTCETVNEQEYFDYCDREELMVLGWIHTHPTQTCFMSSRDLHTHVGYQVMMPESIAIVCAPTKQPR